MNSKGEEEVDEEEKKEYKGQATRGSSSAACQDLFLTSPQSMGEPNAGERNLW